MLDKKRKQAPGIKAVLLLFLVSLVLTLAIPGGQAAHSGDNIDIIFPSESIGQLSILKSNWHPGSVSRNDSVPLGPARGVISVPRNCSLKLVGNYSLESSLKVLETLPAANIIALDLRKLPLDDSKLAPIRHLTALRHLSLEATEVSDGSLKYMVTLPHLQYLSLKSTLFTGKNGGLKDLAQIHSLHQIRLGHNELKGLDLKPLTALKNLTTFQISCSQIDDSAMRAIGSMTQLDSLDISGNNKITDKGLLQLLPIKHLRHLDISDLKISKQGIIALAPMHIKFISLYYRDFKPGELAEIKSHLPGTVLQDATKKEVPSEVYAPLH